MLRGCGGLGRLPIVAGLVAGLAWPQVPALAEVRSTSQTNAYRVPGATAKAVVSHMVRNPFPGDNGGAFANIRPSYRLSIATSRSGGICRAKEVDVDLRFVITLPEARDIDRMSSKTRAAWRSFAAFARRHEEAHRLSYIGCARRFVAAAARETAEVCHALENRIRKMLQQAKRDCEVKQSAFDRRQRNAVYGLALFNMAGY